MCGCDVVALDKGVPISVVIAELKLTFTLDLLLQAVDRLPAYDDVWLAVRASPRGRGRENDARVKKLCRLLGLGLVAVSARDNVEVVVEPVPWRPRRDPKRRSRIVEEHRKRRGDPAVGGSTRRPIMTAYRQQALDFAKSNTSHHPPDVKCQKRSALARLAAGGHGEQYRLSAGALRGRKPAADRRCAPSAACLVRRRWE